MVNLLVDKPPTNTHTPPLSVIFLSYPWASCTEARELSGVERHFLQLGVSVLPAACFIHNCVLVFPPFTVFVLSLGLKRAYLIKGILERVSDVNEPPVVTDATITSYNMIICIVFVQR